MTTARELFDLGYRDLVSITPPHAQISPTSNIKADQLGKVPGRRYVSGWGGYDWRHAAPVTTEDIERWPEGAGVGIRTDRFPAVDIDCTDPALADLILTKALAVLGDAPSRIGRAPKNLLLYALGGESFGRMRLWIGDQLVEVLGDGQQFVAGGIHAATGNPYYWPNGLRAADELTLVSREEIEGFLTELQADCEMLGYECRREGSGAVTVDREAINQEGLRGDAAKVREALGYIPNNNDLFPGRDDYLRMGYAIKGALGEDGRDDFIEWAAKWEGNDAFDGNDPDDVVADWKRMQPPFEVGAPYIFEVAQAFGYNAAGDEFEAVEDAPDEEPADKLKGPIQFSDAALANIFMRMYGQQLRFVPERSAWLSWDGTRWLLGDKARATYLAGVLCQRASNQALDLIANPVKAESVATRLASNATKHSVVAYSEDHPAMQLPLEKLDPDPLLLNTPGGVVDLRNGELLPHDPALNMSRSTTVAPSFEPAPMWARFLHETTAGDVDLQRYLQRLIGYAATGLKTEHNLAFIYGSGGNGKGVFLNTVAAIFGDYAKAASMDTFTASKFDRHPTDMAGLAGARLVTAQETQEGRRWDEQKVKTLTSADKVQARFMREDFFEFSPTFKLVFAGNHKPEIRNLDDAMRRRFHLVPFTVKPKQVDPLLPEKLKAEWPQILGWIIKGAQMWLAEGLNPPESVIEATAEYFDEEDPLGQWIKERIERHSGAKPLASTQLYDNWREWCGENGEHARSVKALVRALKDRGFRAYRSSTFRGFDDLRLTAGPHSPVGGEFL